jgi:hypothetical protein
MIDFQFLNNWKKLPGFKNLIIFLIRQIKVIMLE